MKIVIVDDYPVVREGLTAALHGRDDIEVIGSFGRARRPFTRRNGCGGCCRAHLELPGLGGIDAITLSRCRC